MDVTTTSTSLRRLAHPVGWALLLAACAREPAPPLPPPTPPQAAPAVSFRSAADAPLQVTAHALLTPEGSRRLSEVSAVRVVFALSGPMPSRSGAIELVTPDGSPYDRRELSFAAEHAVQEKTMDLLVAGTLVETADLSGTWLARLFLASAPAAEVAFELQANAR